MPAALAAKPFEDFLLLPSFVSPFPIWQGATNASATHLNVILDTKKKYAFKILDFQGESKEFQIIRNETSPKGKKLFQKIFLENLNPQELYRLQVIDLNSGKVVDEREFQTLDLQRPGFNFALVSCANDFYREGRERMWVTLSAQNPEMIIFIGDSVYADNRNSGIGDHNGGWDNYWDRYVTSFERLSMFRIRRLTPFVAVWDDHDFGINNGDGTFKEKHITTFLFDLFWGYREIPGFQKGPGVSSVLTLAGQRFLLLDDRTFRPAPSESNPSYWGRPIEEFMLDQVAKSADPAWLLAGTQFFGGYLGSDSFESMRESNLKEILGRLQKMEAPVVFGSGDVHFSEVMELEPTLLGYPTFEFTSSGIHSHTFPGQHNRKKNPRRTRAVSDPNFLMIQSTSTGVGQLELKVRSVLKEGLTGFEYTGQIKRS